MIAYRLFGATIMALALCTCGCLSPRNDVALRPAALPAPFSVFTRFPFYAYNQTALQGHGEYGQIPVDFLVILSNHAPQPIMAPDCEVLWPNSVDIEIRTRDGFVHALKSTGVVSIRSADALKRLVVPSGCSIAYPVVLDQRLFQNLPPMSVGDGFHVRASISLERSTNKRGFTAKSKWTPMVYKERVDVERPIAPHGSSAVPRHASSWFRDDGDIEVKVEIDE